MLVRRPQSRLVTIVSFLVCLAITSNSQAQKIYKIVDDKTGKVTYSQVPPKKKSENLRVENMKINHDNASPVRMVDGQAYCGNMRLYVSSKSTKLREPVRYRAMLQSKKENWERSRDRVTKNLARADQAQSDRSKRVSRYETDSTRNRRYTEYEARKAADVKNLRDLQCALRWSEEELASLDGNAPARGSSEKDAKELERLAGLIKQHEARMIKACGSEPVFDPTNIQGQTKTENWRSCTKRYHSEIKKLERRMYTVEHAAKRR